MPISAWGNEVGEEVDFIETGGLEKGRFKRVLGWVSNPEARFADGMITDSCAG